MNPADLLQSLPGLLLAATLPGFALAMLLAPRWRFWEWLAVSLGLSVGFLELLGLAYHHVGIPFEPATAYPVVVMVGGLGFLRWMLARRHSLRIRREIELKPSIAVAGAGLSAGLAGAAALAYSLRDQVLPPDIEAPVHGMWANLIVQTHDVLAPLPATLDHVVYFRPRLAFEATAAMVSMTFGPPPAVSMMPVVLLAVVLLPLGLAMLAFEVSRSPWVAGLAPLLSAGLAFPSFQVELGRFPAVIGATLVAAALVAMARLLRDREPASHALMLIAIAAAMWLTDGLDAATALFLGVPLTLEVVVVRHDLATLGRALAGGAVAGFGVLFAEVVAQAPSAAKLMDVVPGLPGGPPPSVVGAAIDPRMTFEFLAQSDLVSPIALGLLGLGLIAAMARRQLLWALLAFILLLLALADSFYSHLVNWTLVSPWTDPDRLLGVAYWLVPLLMAFGLVSAMSLAIQAAHFARTWAALSIVAMAGIIAVVVGWSLIEHQWTLFFKDDVSPYPWLPMRQLSGLSQWVVPILVTTLILGGTWILLRFLYLAEPGGRRRAMASRTTAAVLASIALGLLGLGLGLRQEIATYNGSFGPRHLVTAADLAVMDAMAQSLPSGSRVLTSGQDGGLWLPAVTPDSLLLPPGSADSDRARALVTTIANACHDRPAAARALATFDIIFIGSHRLGDAPAPWDPQCLASVAGLKEVARTSSVEGDAHAFAVIRP
jgi:hypothetical protein